MFQAVPYQDYYEGDVFDLSDGQLAWMALLLYTILILYLLLILLGVHNIWRFMLQ